MTVPGDVLAIKGVSANAEVWSPTDGDDAQTVFELVTGSKQTIRYDRRSVEDILINRDNWVSRELARRYLDMYVDVWNFLFLQ